MVFTVSECYGFIVPVCIGSITWAYFNAYLVSKVKLEVGGDYQKINDEETGGTKVGMIAHIGKLIAEGADEFLYQEYKYLGLFCGVFSLIIMGAVDIYGSQEFQIYTTVAFLLGCLTSIISGFIGMRIATYANSRTAFSAMTSLGDAFQVAFRAGCVMGFSLNALGLLVLTILIAIYDSIYTDTQSKMFECIAGYGLGGSTVGLFGRVGGGIYTKAADVGADLVGKVENDFAEDSPQNPATIADNVGDNVGDIAGMGADLFGSFAEATCAALVIWTAQDTTTKILGASTFYPLMIHAFGLISCFFTSIFATHLMKVEQNSDIENTLKYQLIISSVILTATLYAAAACVLPDDFPAFQLDPSRQLTIRHPVHAWICTVTGLWSGLIIGGVTEYMTSHSYAPVREVANSCRTGAATNIIYGLALGYKSNVVPVFCLAITSFVNFNLLGLFGISLGALGMLSNLACALAIDAYGPISDNAGGISEMSELGEHVRERTDALDAAGNTTAAIGKGFAIGSAALVSFSLFGAFYTRAREYTQDHQDLIQVVVIDVLNPYVFAGLLIGAMLPYWFSAMTMKSVGKAALEMVNEVRRQLRENPKIRTKEEMPDFNACIKISTQSSLREMVAPGILVMGTPIICGFLFGPLFILGLLPGALISGVQIAISASNTGGAWDNAKKYIESGQLVIDGVVHKKGSEEHKAAVIGDTVGDPLKDTSGPSLNILIKLMAILSLVFCQFFCKTAFLVKPFDNLFF